MGREGEEEEEGEEQKPISHQAGGRRGRLPSCLPHSREGGREEELRLHLLPPASFSSLPCLFACNAMQEKHNGRA